MRSSVGGCVTDPGQGVLRRVDEGTVTEAPLEAGEAFVRDDGSYRIDNVFRVVGATVGDDGGAG